VLAAEAPAPPIRTLREDSRLAAPVGKPQSNGSLTQLLQAAEKASGAELAASEELASRRVTYLSPPVATRTLQAAISDLLAATWSPSGAGWRLAIEKLD